MDYQFVWDRSSITKFERFVDDTPDWESYNTVCIVTDPRYHDEWEVTMCKREKQNMEQKVIGNLVSRSELFLSTFTDNMLDGNNKKVRFVFRKNNSTTLRVYDVRSYDQNNYDFNAKTMLMYSWGIKCFPEFDGAYETDIIVRNIYDYVKNTIGFKNLVPSRKYPEYAYYTKFKTVDAETQQGLPNVSLRITGEGKDVTIVTDRDGTYTLNDMKLGTYNYEETKAPVGYKRVVGLQPFTMKCDTEVVIPHTQGQDPLPDPEPEPIVPEGCDSVPKSGIVLLKVPELSPSYSDTYDFPNKEVQWQYYMQHKEPMIFTEYTYLRKNNSVKIDKHLDEIHGYNYCMYFNRRKLYYAFIMDKEYVNEKTTMLHLATDVMQTYLFDFKLLNSYVDRCHVNRWTADGVPTDEFEPEGLEFGEIIQESTFKIKDFNKTFIAITSDPLGAIDGRKPKEEEKPNG